MTNLTHTERKYILNAARRRQPLHELERKAAKADRMKVTRKSIVAISMERFDLTLAKTHRYDCYLGI